MTEHTHSRIGQRIKALREQRGLTQDELAGEVGFNHRQTLASIEAGGRRVRPKELVRVVAALDVGMDALTDPYRLVAEGRFSFRADGVAAEALDEFEDRAGRWIATFRELERRAGIPQVRLGMKLEVHKSSSFEEAHEAAEQIRQRWQLGDTPAATLREAIERELEAQVLFIDAPEGLSGAAIQLPGLHTILVNRREPIGRRHFDLAHELFHLLTWDAMPPERVEPLDVPPRKGNRVEKLAENFAGALLMPAETVERRWQGRSVDQETSDWLNVTATELQVTAVALKWRMVVLGLLSTREAKAISDAPLAHNGGLVGESTPLMFSRSFVGRVFHATEAGWLSLERAVKILGTTLEEFAALCRAYGLEPSYEI